MVPLAVLPAVVRRYFGPVRGGWAPRAARVGGYAMVLALIAAKAVKDRDGSKLGAYFVVVPGIWVMEILLLLVIAAYVAGLLILTSERVRLTRWILPTGIGFGAVTAGVLYPLAPLGVNVDPNGPSLKWWGLAALALPLATGFLAARLAAGDTRPATLGPTGQGCLAASCAMATAALLLAVLTSVTIALFPHHVPLQNPAAAAGRRVRNLRPEPGRDPAGPPARVLGGTQRRPGGPDAPGRAPDRAVPRRLARRPRRGTRPQIARHQPPWRAARTHFHRLSRPAASWPPTPTASRCIDMLKAAFVQGRLTRREMDLRAGQALAARTYADLAALTADLPARTDQDPASAQARPRAGPGSRWTRQSRGAHGG